MSKTHHEEPVWVWLADMPSVNQDQCYQENHAWVARFFTNGRLAYWQCRICDKQDRVIEKLTERLETVSGWITNPPQLVSRGPRPLASTRKWEAGVGSILVEGEPSSIHFVGEVIPGLEAAHTYIHYDAGGELIETYAPIREQPWPYTDHYWLIRYQVVGTELVRYESHCYEDSTYEVPNASNPKQIVVLSDLRLLKGL